MDISQFEARKRDHIRHALDLSHQAIGLSGLDAIHLYHEALPDLDFEDLCMDSLCFGKKLKTPFYIAGMTAGHADALSINRRLALACQARGWAMGVGSQRRDLEFSRQAEGEKNLKNLFTDSWQKFREEVPELVLFANLGLSQIIQADQGQVLQVVEALKADALSIHANALQEVIQVEGTPQFRGGLQALEEYSKKFPSPIILKETGCGFSPKTLQRISKIPLAALDVSGLGGTHWGRIEGARLQPKSVHAIAAETFANWGETTVQSVLSARKILNKTEVWASGGVRTGLDAAKLIALGAQRVGFAQPALEAALEGEAALQAWMEAREYELKIALFCTGSLNLEQLGRPGNFIHLEKKEKL